MGCGALLHQHQDQCLVFTIAALQLGANFLYLVAGIRKADIAKLHGFDADAIAGCKAMAIRIKTRTEHGVGGLQLLHFVLQIGDR